MGHDRLFKELLSTFFLEFVDLFLPAVAGSLDKDYGVVPLDKEIFTDIGLKDTHEVDLLMRARFRGQDAFFLIHVENQAKAQTDFPKRMLTDFPKRMFRYFAQLTEKHDLPVYPVVIFSYDKPDRPEPNRYEIAFPDEIVLDFRYRVIQLNNLSWRDYVHQPNPVAAALMAKMQIAVEDRPRVKLECLRLLATLRLDPARSKLIGVFVENYLRLTAEEIRRYHQQFEDLHPQEREKTMEMMTSWELAGVEKGLSQGKEGLIVRLLNRRFGSVSDDVSARLHGLTPDQLDDLGVALLDFTTPEDLERWFTRH